MTAASGDLDHWRQAGGTAGLWGICRHLDAARYLVEACPHLLLTRQLTELAPESRRLPQGQGWWGRLREGCPRSSRVGWVYHGTHGEGSQTTRAPLQLPGTREASDMMTSGTTARPSVPGVGGELMIIRTTDPSLKTLNEESERSRIIFIKFTPEMPIYCGATHTSCGHIPPKQC